MASTSTWWGGYFLWPTLIVLWSRLRQSRAMGCLLVWRKWLSSFIKLWLQLKRPVASQSSSQPLSSLPLMGLSVSCFMIWQ